MDLYEAIEKRRTVRDFLETPVSEDVLRRILVAGLKAPSHDHARDWHFVVIRDPERIAAVLTKVEAGAHEQMEFVKRWTTATDRQREMYMDAIPKQTRMLMQSRCLVLPFFRAGEELMHPVGVTSLNPFASIWCVLENVFLAATAEEIACAMRIPIGDEEAHAIRTVGAPEGWRMPCYLAFGYAAPDAPVLRQTECPLDERLHFNAWN